jgi:hypothetical protein
MNRVRLGWKTGLTTIDIYEPCANFKIEKEK